MSGPGNCNEVVLEKGKVALIQRLRRNSVPNGMVDVRELADTFVDEMAFELSCYVLKQTVSVTPSSWWQHFKKDCMPKWFVKRWPVKFIEYEVVIRCDPSLDSPGPVVRFVGYDKPKVINYERNGDIR